MYILDFQPKNDADAVDEKAGDAEPEPKKRRIGEHTPIKSSKSNGNIRNFFSPLPACRGTLSLLAVCLSVSPSVSLSVSPSVSPSH